MKMLSCKKMGKDCDFVAKGETSEEVKSKIMEHAKMEHADMLSKMSESEKADLMKKMDEKMEDVSA